MEKSLRELAGTSTTRVVAAVFTALLGQKDSVTVAAVLPMLAMLMMLLKLFCTRVKARPPVVEPPPSKPSAPNAGVYALLGVAAPSGRSQSLIATTTSVVEVTRTERAPKGRPS